MVIHPAINNQSGNFKSHSNEFTWPLPKSAMRYTAIHDFDTGDKSMGEVGFNYAGIGISATETIYNGKSVLAIDPYKEKTGITLPEWQCAARIITRRWKYLERISVPGALRYGIDGLPAGVVSEHEARHARAFLASKLASKNKNNGANDKSVT